MACKKYLCSVCGKWRGQMTRHISAIHKVENPTYQDIQKYFPNRADFKI